MKNIIGHSNQLPFWLNKVLYEHLYVNDALIYAVSVYTLCECKCVFSDQASNSNSIQGSTKVNQAITSLNISNIKSVVQYYKRVSVARLPCGSAGCIILIVDCIFSIANNARHIILYIAYTYWL